MSSRNTKTPTKPDGVAKWQVPMRPNPKSGLMEYYLEGEIRDKFIELFPKHSNRRIMQWFGLSFSTLQRFRRELGLKKDMREIRMEQARDAKRTCEKNGYNESLRGKKPSEANLEAVRRIRDTVFLYLKRLKEISPDRYKAMMERKSKVQKEVWRKEKLRAMYGLERKTRLRIPDRPMTRRASVQKSAMIKSCNYFAIDDDVWTVCYDSQTRRSPRREATAIKYGLKIVEGED